MWAPGAKAPLQDAAVIDVGSNSVRLVLYRLDGRAIWTVFNEKVLAGLGRDLPKTGRLSPEGVKSALAALRRFRAVIEAAGISHVFAGATAAVREAADGKAFIDKIRQETGLKVRILSGDEEARYSALGVAAGQPDADGVVADLGGSSLELIPLRMGEPGVGVTLPLGPLALGAPGPLDAAAVRQACVEAFAPIAERFQAKRLYAVGGAWRNLALLHMQIHGYRLRVVHQYEMTAREALEAAHFLTHQSKSSLERIEGVSKKRLETLPYAGVVLEQLIHTLGIERICASAYGLREGLIFEAMEPGLRALDPLVEGCAALGARFGVADQLGPALQAWLLPFWAGLDPVFGVERDAILMAAACRMADIGARLHPDHRAELVFDQVLRAPIAGQTHAERAFLAITVFARHTTREVYPDPEIIDRLLDAHAIRRARVLGGAIRVGCDLSGRSPSLLAGSSLSLEKGFVVLIAPKGAGDLLVGEQTAKRLAQLAAALDLKPEIRNG